MVTFTEGRHAGEGLLSESNFHRSRDKITILSGSGVLSVGTVLGIAGLGAFATYVSEANDFHRIEERDR